MSQKKLDWAGAVLCPHDMSLSQLSAGIVACIMTAKEHWELALEYRAEFDAALEPRKRRRWPNMSAGAVLRLAYFSTQAALNSLRRAEALIDEAGKRFDAEHAQLSTVRAKSLPAPRTPGKGKAGKGQTNAGRENVLLSFGKERTKKGQRR